MWNGSTHWFTLTGLCLVFYFRPCLSADELWERDLSEEITIGLSTTGYQSVDLKCGSDAFQVNVTVEDDFDGVIYTRGDFSSKKKPCFLKSRDVAKRTKKSKIYSLQIPFLKCHTVEDASEAAYTNILVLQHDSELIIPGDAAFQLSCAFNPEQSLGTSMLATSKSKIVLVDADPASKKISEEYQASSDSDSVSFTSDKDENLPKKDEL